VKGGDKIGWKDYRSQGWDVVNKSWDRTGGEGRAYFKSPIAPAINSQTGGGRPNASVTVKKEVNNLNYKKTQNIKTIQEPKNTMILNIT